MLIRWTEPATSDLTHICDFLKEHASSGIARRVALSIFENIGTLADFPEMGRIGRKSGTRELIFAALPYVVVYRVPGKESLEVLRILHGAQDWP
jgi:toxin ParE1/3/4